MDWNVEYPTQKRSLELSNSNPTVVKVSIADRPLNVSRQGYLYNWTSFIYLFDPTAWSPWAMA
jgi:hypothetical protein